MWSDLSLKYIFLLFRSLITKRVYNLGHPNKGAIIPKFKFHYYSY